MRLNSPETPFIASGILVVATAVKRDGALQAAAFRGILASLVIVVLASYTAGTRAAPIVRAIGIVSLLATLTLAVRVYTEK